MTSTYLTVGNRGPVNFSSWPITSWEIDGEIVEKVSDFIFGGSKITTDGDCSHEIKSPGENTGVSCHFL